MTTTKQEFSAIDAAPVVLYAKLAGDTDNKFAFPLVATSSGSLTLVQAGYTEIGTGRRNVSAGPTRIQLQDHPCKAVILTAYPSNTGYIYYGDSNVNSTSGSEFGAILYQGQTTQTLTISNTNLLWIVSQTAGNGVSYVYFN